MDNELKQYIRTLLPQYLDMIEERGSVNANGETNYKCPLPHCNSGRGKNESAAFFMKNNGEVWYCQSCKKSGDIFDLIAIRNGKDITKDFKEIADIAAAELGINTENVDLTAYRQQAAIKKQSKSKELEPVERMDYTEFLKECKANVKQTDYFKNRGLSDAIIDRFNLGYITAETYEKYKEKCNLKNNSGNYIFMIDYVIIPYNKKGSYWTARNTMAFEKNYRYNKPLQKYAGSEPVFNEAELDRQTAEPLFITEGQIDCISIIQAGGSAIATGGTGIDKLKAALNKRPEFKRPLIIALDDDYDQKNNPGRTAAQNCKDMLDEKQLANIIFDYGNAQREEADKVKDCNEYLQKHKEEFEKAIKASIELAGYQSDSQDERKAEEAEDYSKGSVYYKLDGFFENAKNQTPPTPTGYKNLDDILDGGLYEGLYVVGAISSLGKTTFVLQMADQIAQGGKDVLIFSLEMAESELIAKSISRNTYKIDPERARQTRDITNPTKFLNNDMTILNQATDLYKQYAERVFICEGLGDIGVEKVTEIAKEHKKYRGEAPIVIIDYLQILAPYSDRYTTDKQNTDKNVLELKRLSRELKTPVIAISSLNRENYNTKISLTAFKESGAIEYSSDVLIGLQPAGIDNAISDTAGITKDGRQKSISDSTQAAAVKNHILETKEKEIRTMELVILKNRNGKTGRYAYYKYNTLYNCFDVFTDGCPWDIYGKTEEQRRLKTIAEKEAAAEREKSKLKEV